MHPAGKVFMAIGVFILIGGVALIVIGGNNVEDFGEWDPEEKSAFSGTSGTTTFDYSGEDMIVMVRDNVRCDEFSMSMTNDTTDNFLTIECVEDGAHPIGWEDDPEGWYHMTTISYWDYNEGQYTIEANANYEIVPLWEVVGEEVGEAVGGLFQGAAGGMLVCCGGVVTIFGLILGLLVNNNQKTIIVQNGAMPGNTMMQANQTMVTQPVYQKSYAEVPVQPQTTMPQESTTSVWDQEEPKNPF